MVEDGIYIRNAAGGPAFFYTVVRGGRPVESGTVDVEDEVAPGYYGGSEAMD
jgi:hypothetical protein